MIEQNKIHFLSCNLHNLTMNETIEIIDDRITNGIFTQHSVVNVAKLVNMQNDKELHRSVNDCEIINIDGMGIVLGARFCGIDIKERVAGIDLFEELVKLSAAKNYPIFLLGAKENVVNDTKSTLLQKYNNLKIAGIHHGYFWDDEEIVVEKIKKSGAKLLFVAITSPKKENFINKWKDELGVEFVMGVGGSFDVVAGKVKRAPNWMQRSGLEWFFRLAQEPRRMFKRYAITNIKFLFLILNIMIKGK